MHSTSKLEDGYIGSGKRLGNSIKKYGIENHSKGILEFLPDRSSLKEREKNLVNEDLLQDPMCMNIQPGGGGGCSEEVKQIWIKAGLDGIIEKWKDLEYKSKMKKIASDNFKKLHKDGKINYDTFKGRSHSEETKSLMRDKAKERVGDKNSQFGSCWITNGTDSKKWKKSELIPEGWNLGRVNKSSL